MTPDTDRVQGSVKVNIPTEALWQFFTESGIWPRWNWCFWWVRNRNLTLGQQLVWIFRTRQYWPLPAAAKITEFDETTHRVTWTVDLLGLRARHTYYMEELGNGWTRFGSSEIGEGWSYNLFRRFWISHFSHVRDRSLEGVCALRAFYHPAARRIVLGNEQPSAGDVRAQGKDLGPLRHLPRSPFASYRRRARLDVRARLARRAIRYRGMITFLYNLEAAVGLAREYLKYRFGRAHQFMDYRSSCDHGIYQLGDDRLIGGEKDPADEVRVSLAGDWGSGTDEAELVGRRIRHWRPHYTIHLGDVYYVGAAPEVNENCLGMPDPSHAFRSVTWPIGSVGSFAMNGNHEMYALGSGYFDLLLPRLGMRPGVGQAPSGQGASFFCLQNECWSIIGLDTGYCSTGAPIVEYFINPACELRDEILEWLRDFVRPQHSRRGLILLTHHQYCEAFGQAYPAAGRQLSKVIDRPVLWFWAHEHRMAIYGRHQERGGVAAYGRCLGHGGMPVDLIPDQPLPKEPLVLYDNRRYESPECISVGYNGFANLTFKKDRLTVEYRDLADTVLVREHWEVKDGVPLGKNIELLCSDPNIRHDPDLERAIRP